MKSRDAFPTQAVWYVRAALALKASRYVSHSDLTNCFSIVCLGEFAEDDLVHDLDCIHAFHVDCLDEWYSRGHNQCPLCKSELCHSTAADANSELHIGHS
jgi:hypothetical protein